VAQNDPDWEEHDSTNCYEGHGSLKDIDIEPYFPWVFKGEAHCKAMCDVDDQCLAALMDADGLCYRRGQISIKDCEVDPKYTVFLAVGKTTPPPSSQTHYSEPGCLADEFPTNLDPIYAVCTSPCPDTGECPQDLPGSAKGLHQDGAICGKKGSKQFKGRCYVPCEVDDDCDTQGGAKCFPQKPLGVCAYAVDAYDASELTLQDNETCGIVYGHFTHDGEAYKKTGVSSPCDCMHWCDQQCNYNDKCDAFEFDVIENQCRCDKIDNGFTMAPGYKEFKFRGGRITTLGNSTVV
jgi:hypothetical protein